MAKPTILPSALILCFLLIPTLSVSKPLKGCKAKEQAALLSFKEGLEDPSNRLSTWRGEDCCAWKGVVCSNKTGHVVRLDLHNTIFSGTWSPDQYYALTGNISSSLVALRHMNYLDLSMNTFYGSQIPEFIGSMSNLRYLNLSGTSFIGNIPPQLGNLSNLIYLDLNSQYSFYYGINPIYSKDLAWLHHLPMLEYLDMTNVNISTVENWPQLITMLPSLKHLYLCLCSLQKPTFSPLLSNLSNLVAFDISNNYFGDTTSLNWVSNLTSLKYLDMSENDLNGIFPGMFNNLCNIKELYLMGNPMNMDITELVHVLSQCLRSKLQSLDLGSTNVVGNLSSFLEHMTSLRTLDLFDNNLTGPIPSLIRATRLSSLDLSDNFLDGAVSKDHFVNLMNLESLYLEGNHLIVDQNWVPPISLRLVSLRSCKLGPKFPPWIRRLTSITILDISYTSIVDKVPDWFWNTSSHLLFLDLSNNQISGNIHKALQFTSLEVLYLQNNVFENPIPPLPQNLTMLDLSNNSLSGPLSLKYLAPNLICLLLQDNLLNGTIPASICQLHSLKWLDLSSNLFWGPLPKCWMDSDFSSQNLSLNVLMLRNNALSDTFPSFLRNCQQLRFLDLSYNKFSGRLPSWIGDKLLPLQFLLLRSNMFSGDIPIQITKLYALKVLDLAHNNFSRTIPQSLNNFNGMIQLVHEVENPLYVFDSLFNNYRFDMDNLNVVTKGTSLVYMGFHLFITSIDLSFNSFEGDIPEEICSLTGLINLNLSGNSLNGNIPERIGAMQALESLDLSYNDLSGTIPISLSNITSLSHMNLSCNNLSGKIPSGYQLQTLDDPSIYIGNSGLCGPPLSKNCSGNGITIPQGNESRKEDGSDVMSLYLGICIGFIFGLWLVFCVFLFRRKYRIAYFRATDDLYDWVYVFVLSSWKRAFGK